MGLRYAHIDAPPDALAKDAGRAKLRIVRGVDASIEAMVNEVREQAGLPLGEEARSVDEAFEGRLPEIRLHKDAFESAELARTVEVTCAGFEDIVRVPPRAAGHRHGECVVESALGAVTREEGNGLGYDTIAASGNHTNILHWTDNDGPMNEGDLILADAGAEVDLLYTANITRTLPVNGCFTGAQARVYQAVLDVHEAALARANGPGIRPCDVHDTAMLVIATRLYEWGPLPVSVEESLPPTGQQHRRQMLHDTSHHLGLNVHGCTQARREMHQDAFLESGMTSVIEPGLCFRADDEAIPVEYRGIGVRIEDDVAMNEDGSVTRTSEGIPRTIDDVGAWIARAQGR